MSDPNAPHGAPPPEPGPAGQPGPQGQPPPQDQPMPQGQAPYAQPAGSGYGGLGKRFLARIIDALIVGIPVSIILSVIPGLRPGGIIGTALSSAAAFAYFIFLETSQGATFGKKVLSMSVAEESGTAPISMDASIKRNWWLLIGALGGIPIIGLITSLASLIIVIVIAVTISSDSRNQGWHDKMGGTLVLDRPAA